MPRRILAAQTAGCASISLLLLIFDRSLGLSVLLAGVVLLLPSAWFARQISGSVRAARAARAAEVSLDAHAMARAHLWQAGARWLATVLLMAIVISGYEALNPLGFFACLMALMLTHFGMAFGTRCGE